MVWLGFHAATAPLNHESRNGTAQLVCDHGALGLEHQEHLAIGVIQRFVVSLAFCNDQIGLIKTPAELITAIVKKSPWRIGAIVDHFDDIGESGDLDVAALCIIQYGRASHNQGHAISAKLFDQQAIENDLASVVGQI